MGAKLVLDFTPARYARHPLLSGEDRKHLFIQFRIAPENAALVERNAPLGGEIGRDILPPRDAIVHRGNARRFPLEPLHRLWKRVAQTLDQLEYR